MKEKIISNKAKLTIMLLLCACIIPVIFTLTTNFAVVSAISLPMQVVDYLIDNTVCGNVEQEWDYDLEYYNCYAYALGKTDRWYEPGDFSNVKVNTYGEYVKSDLEALGYDYVYVTKTVPKQPIMLKAGQNLICVRVGGLGFHFMKYDADTDAWYQKPGENAILKYNYQPADKPWVDEHFYRGAYYRSGLTYYTEIEYIYFGDSPIDVQFEIKYKNSGGTPFTGTLGDGTPTSHSNNESTALVNPRRLGYTFNGWYLTGNCSGTALTQLPSGYDCDVTLYANWTQGHPPHLSNYDIYLYNIYIYAWTFDYSMFVIGIQYEGYYYLDAYLRGSGRIYVCLWEGNTIYEFEDEYGMICGEPVYLTSDTYYYVALESEFYLYGYIFQMW